MTETAEQLQAAFLAAAKEAQSAIDMPALTVAIERKDHKAILELLGIADGRYPILETALSGRFSNALADAYERSARTITGHTPELAQHSQELRANIVTELSAASARGVTSALDTAIKLSSPTMRVQTLTSLIGLTERQARSLADFAAGLEQLHDQFRFTTTLRIGQTVTSEVTSIPGLSPQQTRFLSASQRSMIDRAFRLGSTPEKVQRLLQRQARIFIEHRVRTASEFQLSRVREEAKQQAATRVKNPGEVRRYWIDAGDEHVRTKHRAVSALNPAGVAVNQPFNTAFGPRMVPPLEINCRCRVEYRRPNGERV